MAQAADFVAGHGRLPKRHSGDPAEERLAQWLRYMRSLHRRGLLRPGRAERLDSLGHWRRSPKIQDEDAYWFARMSDLEAFTVSAGRLPQPGKECR